MNLLDAFHHHFQRAIGDRHVLLFGENIDNGSMLSGLGKGLASLPNATILNVGNCELTHVGTGMGIMIEGGHAILFVKQLDFLLLALDQMVNTLNSVRAGAPVAGRPLGSFTIVTYLCDQGYQGPQSSMVDLTGFASLGAFPGFLLQEFHQIESVLRTQLFAPGFRILGIPQGISRQPVAHEVPTGSGDGWRIYGTSDGVWIVSCHSTFAQALELRKMLEARATKAAILQADILPGLSVAEVLGSHRPVRAAVVMDDAKGLVKWGDLVVRQMALASPRVPLFFLDRPRNDAVGQDQITWPLESLADQLAKQ
ncbi:MAG: hypothetical protein WCS65_04830 [Verrucomicrobiae bacterium]